MKNIPTSQRVIEIKHKRRVRLVRLLVLFFLLLLSIFLSLGYFSHNERFTINKIKVEGASIIDQEEIILLTEELLEGRYFYLYNRANSFIFPEKAIYLKLIEDFPRIEELSVSREGLNILNIKIKERLGSYLYCGEVVPEIESEIGENCYFINNDGFIFDEAPYFSGNVYFRYYTKIDNQVDSLGQYIFEPNRFHELIRFTDKIMEFDFIPTSLFLNEDGVYSLYLEHKTGDSKPKIIFREDNDLIEILNNLEIAMGKDEFSKELKFKYNMLEYIDLRFKNKVLYKFK